MRKHARIVDLPGYWGNAAELGFYLAPSTVTVSNNTSMHPHHAAKVDSKDESEKFSHQFVWINYRHCFWQVFPGRSAKQLHWSLDSHPSCFLAMKKEVNMFVWARNTSQGLQCTDSAAKGSSFSQHIWSPLSFRKDLQFCTRSFSLPGYAAFLYKNTLPAFGRAFLSFSVMQL